MHPNGIPEPPTLVSQLNPAIVLGVFAVIVVIAAVAAVVFAVRERDFLPIVACIGSLVCALNEPIYDILGKIVYANNHPMAFSGFGREIPLFLVIGYLPWVGFLPYLIARMMKAGVSRTRLHMIALVSFLSVVVVESIGTSFHAWAYYGIPPLKYLVVAPQMAPVPIVGGFLLYAIAFPLRGWRRAVASFAISTLALPMVFASASWPLYVGLNITLPPILNWIAGLVMLAFSAGIVYATTDIARRLREGQQTFLEPRVEAGQTA